MTEAKIETKNFLVKGKKAALIIFWTYALKYGAATNVITIPVFYILLSL